MVLTNIIDCILVGWAQACGDFGSLFLFLCVRSLVFGSHYLGGSISNNERSLVIVEFVSSFGSIINLLPLRRRHLKKLYFVACVIVDFFQGLSRTRYLCYIKFSKEDG